MTTAGISQAKTKFTSLCEAVVKSGDAILVSKRGRPVVMLSPVPANFQNNRVDILTAWKEWKKSSGTADTDFPEVWKLRGTSKPNPLAE